MKPTTSKGNLLFFLALLLCLTPLIHDKSAIYGTVVHRTLYFWTIIDISLLIVIIYQKAIKIHFSFLQIAISGYLIISLCAALLGYDIYLNLFSNFERMMGFLSLLHFVIFFFIFGSITFSTKEVNILLAISLITGIGISIFGISETLNGRYDRAESILSNPMHFAIYLVALIYLGIYCFYRWQNPLLRIACMFYLTVCLLALILTQTRAGVLSLIAGLLVAIIIWIAQSAKKLRYTFIFAALLISFMGLGWLGLHYLAWEKIPLINRLADIDFANDTFIVRMRLWKMCLFNSFERPLLGWGQGSFIYFYFNHFTSDLNNAGFWYDSAHNNFIDTIIGTGYIGLFAYCSVFFAAFYTIWHKKGSYFTNAEKILITSFLSAYIVFMFFGFDSFISYFGLFIFLIIIHKNSVTHWSFRLPEISGIGLTLVKVFAGAITVAVLYFFCFKSIRTNYLLSQAYAQNEVEQMTHLFKDSYNQAIIGEYDIAVSFALKKEAVFNSNLPSETKNAYFGDMESMLLSSLKKHINNPILLNQKGFLEFESGRKSQGIRTFEVMNQLSPNRLINHYDYAWILYNSNQMSKSISILDKVIKTQQFNSKAILLKARIYFEKKMVEQAFEALKAFTPKEIIEHFKEITDLIFEYGQYKPFYYFIYAKFHPDHISDLVLTEEQLLTWAQIAQLSKDKAQVYSVFSYYAGNTLMGANGHFRQKQDSLKVLDLIDKVHQGTVNYDIILTLRDF
jgi:O-antigen ligase/tetratricopeptide (TPR) repeat protein